MPAHEHAGIVVVSEAVVNIIAAITDVGVVIVVISIVAAACCGGQQGRDEVRAVIAEAVAVRGDVQRTIAASGEGLVAVVAVNVSRHVTKDDVRCIVTEHARVRVGAG